MPSDRPFASERRERAAAAILECRTCLASMSNDNMGPSDLVDGEPRFPLESAIVERTSVGGGGGSHRRK